MKKSRYFRSFFKITAVIVMLGIVLSGIFFCSEKYIYAADPYLLSLNRTVYASSSYGASDPAAAVDGNDTTRWESGWGIDPQWIYVDLGANVSITSVVLKWEAAYSKAYQIQISNDEITWSTVYTNSNCLGGNETLNITATGRYVRLYSTQRVMTQYGISLFEFQVYGTGGINPPVNYGTNVALNKPATAFSVQVDWYITPGETDASNAVDGDLTTRWGSNQQHDPEWLYVDLGASHTIGRVVIKWEAAAARIFDIQVSNDASNWTTKYREMNGVGGTNNIQLYMTGRYVRVYGISRATTFGYSILEFEVYDYIPGDPQPTYSIPALPTSSTVTVGSGSYITNDITLPQPKYPGYKSSDIVAPIPSNDWWQSLLVNHLGNGIITLPLKNKFTAQGLSVLNPGAGYVDGIGYNAAGSPDLYLMANNINTTLMESKVVKYGDWSVDAVLSDDTTEKMRVTFVKGSPYVFAQFSDANSPEIYSSCITRIFDDNNNTMLITDGSTVTTDHIGIQVTNTDSAPTPQTFTRYYAVTVPSGTVFTKAGNKIKIRLGGGQTYMSIAAIPSYSNLNYFYQHGYAFVTDSKVSYNFDAATSNITVNYNLTTSLKRTGFSSNTLMALLPHQWKVTTSALTSYTYPSIRGAMKVREGNSFTTVDRFYGIVPQFTEPNDSSYSRTQLQQYLNIFDGTIAESIMNADPYWQGKTLHPLAMAVLIADQIGNTAARDNYLSKLRTALVDWYTYTNGEPDYFFYYNNEWGTMIYKNSGFGANTGITDHHFTYGYYLFASAILASYDSTFLNNYKGMIEHLIRDYANPSRTDSMYPLFRNFDVYEGHSWAGGYADNDSGNNQEAAGEALFGWVGQYLWGIVTGNTAYRDAAIYGFTTEEKAIEQYWFNYDHDNWVSTWPYGAVGQVWGSGYLFGNYFWGCTRYNYGIHWLPTAEWLTYYGKNPTKAAELYSAFVSDNGGDEVTAWNGESDSWYHIIWPVQALSDPQGALSKWTDTNLAKMQQNEMFNAYWFLHGMATLGQRTTDIYAGNWSCSTVYKNGAQYTALVWNPTNAAVSVSFRNTSGTTVGSTTVPAKSMVSVNPNTHSNPTPTPTGAATPTPTPTGGPTPTPGGVNLALNKMVTVSSAENAGTPGSAAVDGNAGTRWSSAASDPQWIYVDLGATYTVSQVKLNWETACASAYQIQVSTNATSWTNVWSTTTGTGGIVTINFIATNARYVRMYGTARATVWGYSLWEFEVYGSSTATPTPTRVATATPTPTRTATSTPTPTPGGVNLAFNKTVTVSSAENAGTPGSAAVDGNAGTRWSSAASDPQWIYVDLGAIYTVSQVKLNWETACASAYQIQVSTNATSWTNVWSTTTGTGGILTINFTAISARYVRMYGTARATAWGYSLWEFEVYGSSSATPTPTRAATATPTPTPSNVNLALNKTATASSTENGSFPASSAIDGNIGTRWASAFSDPQWIRVDLGQTYSISRVVLRWEPAYATSYQIQTSTDGTTWTNVWSTTSGTGGMVNATFTPRSARYVRMYGTVRATQYGYSLWEFEVYQ